MLGALALFGEHDIPEHFPLAAGRAAFVKFLQLGALPPCVAFADLGEIRLFVDELLNDFLDARLGEILVVGGQKA